MKKLLLRSIFSLILTGVLFVAKAGEFYVSPEGSDQNPGTKVAPFKTIERARDAARTVNKSEPGETVVYLRGGIYQLNQTVEFGPEDSGTESHPVIYRAYPNERPIISGGRYLTGWEESGDGLWQTSIGELNFRQMYVNEIKAPRSRFPKEDNFLRMIHWDESNNTLLLPSGTLQNWSDFESTEIYVQMAWSISIMRLKEFTESDEGDVLTVTNPERDLVFRRSPPRRRPGQAFHFENSKAFIEEPGEWSVDLQNGICTYMPRSGESIADVSVIVPHVETLFRILGTLDEPVRHFQVEGLTFMHSNWNRPNHKGYLNAQAGQFTIEPTKDNIQYVERPPAAVYAAGVENLLIRRNVFTKLGAVGLDIHYGSKNSEVVGNVFYNIAGSGISIARFSDPDVEIHHPYNPEDPRDRCVDDWIHNNYIESVGFEYGGAIGIAAGYATSILIEHNELRNLAYTGISLGWGWTDQPNAMKNNRIIANVIEAPMLLFSDGGGIYTLSEMPGSLIARNFIRNVKRSEWADPHTTTKAYYLDEHTGGMTFSSNWFTDIGPAVERIFFNRPGHIHITPFEQRVERFEIMDNAGLKEEYRDIVRLARD